MLIFCLILLAVIFLSYSNGANDNFKGVATLLGSDTTDYKSALSWATVTTLLGSFTAIMISAKLVASFSGKGLVPNNLIENPVFLISVAFGAAVTVFIASLTGIPISTTHSLTGALVGVGLAASGSEVNFGTLGVSFFLPLLLSPLAAIVLISVIYPVLRFTRMKLGIERKMCLCVGQRFEPVSIQHNGTILLESSRAVLAIDQIENCRQFYQGRILGFDCQNIIDKLHYLSAGGVSFARGLNDTPKIVALLLAASAFSLKLGIFIVAVVMAVGGILNAKKVAFTMSRQITQMNHGQGFAANLVTAFLVIVASKWGMPVSTTHVSCGSLFGIGLINKKASLSVIRQIILAWLLTLPLAAIIAGICFFVLTIVR